MKKTIQKECLYILLAISMSAILLMLFAQILEKLKAPDMPDTSPGFSWSFDYRSAVGSSPPSPSSTSTKEEFVLFIGESKSFHNMTLIFRGKINRRTFRIDKIIHALDPTMTYPQDISIKEARSGITIMNNTFKLISIDKNSIRLIYDKKT
jgi:hypothetical protein